MEDLKLVRKAEVMIAGLEFGIKLFISANGKGVAVTRYDHEDIILTDGRNVEDAYKRHNAILPLAISVRNERYTTYAHEI